MAIMHHFALGSEENGTKANLGTLKDKPDLSNGSLQQHTSVSHESGPGHPLVYADFVIKLSVVVFMIFSILVFNGLSIVVRLTHPNLRRQVSSAFIRSLACADLCVGMVHGGPALVSALLLDTTLDSPWLELCAYLSLATTTLSLYTMACISIDRYIAITRPLRYAVIMLAKPCAIVIALTWVWSALIALPMATPVIKKSYNPASFVCVLDYSESVPYLTVLIYTIYAPTFLVVTAVYFKLMLISRRHVKQMHKDTNRHSNDPLLNSQPESLSRRTKYLRNTLFILQTFYLSWLPRCAYVLYLLISHQPSTTVPWLEFITSWLSICHSFFNCLTYSWFNVEFRQSLRDLLGCCPYYGQRYRDRQRMLIFSVQQQQHGQQGTKGTQP